MSEGTEAIRETMRALLESCSAHLGEKIRAKYLTILMQLHDAAGSLPEPDFKAILLDPETNWGFAVEQLPPHHQKNAMRIVAVLRESLMTQQRHERSDWLTETVQQLQTGEEHECQAVPCSPLVTGSIGSRARIKERMQSLLQRCNADLSAWSKSRYTSTLMHLYAAVGKPTESDFIALILDPEMDWTAAAQQLPEWYRKHGMMKCVTLVRESLSATTSQQYTPSNSARILEASPIETSQQEENGEQHDCPTVLSSPRATSTSETGEQHECPAAPSSPLVTSTSEGTARMKERMRSLLQRSCADLSAWSITRYTCVIMKLYAVVGKPTESDFIARILDSDTDWSAALEQLSKSYRTYAMRSVKLVRESLSQTTKLQYTPCDTATVLEASPTEIIQQLQTGEQHECPSVPSSLMVTSTIGSRERIKERMQSLLQRSNVNLSAWSSFRYTNILMLLHGAVGNPTESDFIALILDPETDWTAAAQQLPEWYRKHGMMKCLKLVRESFSATTSHQHTPPNSARILEASPMETTQQEENGEQHVCPTVPSSPKVPGTSEIGEEQECPAAPSSPLVKSTIRSTARIKERMQSLLQRCNADLSDWSKSRYTSTLMHLYAAVGKPTESDFIALILDPEMDWTAAAQQLPEWYRKHGMMKCVKLVRENLSATTTRGPKTTGSDQSTAEVAPHSRAVVEPLLQPQDTIVARMQDLEEQVQQLRHELRSAKKQIAELGGCRHRGLRIENIRIEDLKETAGDLFVALLHSNQRKRKRVTFQDVYFES